MEKFVAKVNLKGKEERKGLLLGFFEDFNPINTMRIHGGIAEMEVYFEKPPKNCLEALANCEDFDFEYVNSNHEEQFEESKNQSIGNVEVTEKSESTEQVEEEAESEPTEHVEEEAESEPTEHVEEEAESEPTEQVEEETESEPTDQAQEEAESKPTEQVEEEAEPEPTEHVEKEAESKPTEQVEEETESESTEHVEKEAESKPTEQVEEETESESTEQVEKETESKPTEQGEEEAESESTEQFEKVAKKRRKKQSKSKAEEVPELLAIANQSESYEDFIKKVADWLKLGGKSEMFVTILRLAPKAESISWINIEKIVNQETDIDFSANIKLYFMQTLGKCIKKKQKNITALELITIIVSFEKYAFLNKDIPEYLTCLTSIDKRKEINSRVNEAIDLMEKFGAKTSILTKELIFDIIIKFIQMDEIDSDKLDTVSRGLFSKYINDFVQKRFPHQSMIKVEDFLKVLQKILLTEDELKQLKNS